MNKKEHTEPLDERFLEEVEEENQLKKNGRRVPYHFEGGNRKDKFLSVLIFQKYVSMKQLQKDFFDKKGINTKPAKRLRWLLKQAEKKTPEIECPRCGSRPIRNFSIFDTFSSAIASSVEEYISRYTCCDHFICEDELRVDCTSRGNCKIVPFTFKSLEKLNSIEREQALYLYQEGFKLDFDPTSLDPENEDDAQKALDFFKG